MKNEKDDINERLDKYLILTKEALKKASSHIGKNKEKDSEIILDMAKRYYDDALYFKSKGELLLALSAVSYAHGWLDCGSRLGFFEVKDNKLFITKE